MKFTRHLELQILYKPYVEIYIWAVYTITTLRSYKPLLSLKCV